MRVIFLAVSVFFGLCLMRFHAQAQISADYSNGGAVRPGASTTTCDAAAEGAIRYNTTSDNLEFCNGTAWNTLVQTQTSAGVTAPAGSGYFVLTHTTWNGNLGGISGADAKCFTELGTTYTSWRGYTAANANGQINSSKIKAFICDQDVCNNLLPLTTYYFAYANSGTPGGASFTTDASGNGPGNNIAWSAANYFGGTYTYWTNRADSSATMWSGNPSGGIYSSWKHCANWADSASTSSGQLGYSSMLNDYRWTTFDMVYACNQTNRLICLVNP